MNRKIKVLMAAVLVVTVIFVFGACGSSDKTKTDNKSGKSETQNMEVDPKAETLTIQGQASDEGDKLQGKTYTADELKKIGVKTATYSGRNKKVQNKRIFTKVTGVDLIAALKDAGVSNDDVDDAVITVKCSDGYQMEYEVEELYDDKYAFKDNKSDKKAKVGAMIAISEKEGDYPSPFQIVFGQEAYDTYDNSAQDFNMQKWGSYIQIIDVSFPED